MRTGLLYGLAFAFAIFGVACQQQATNGNANSAAHQSHTNHSLAMTANGNSAVNHGSMQDHTGHDMSAMNHSEMKSDQNAANAPYDLQFLDTMIHHHQGAIDMAQVALKNSQNEELRKFAEKIINDQQKEIGQMKEWRDKWFAGRPRALNMEMPGMMDSMKDMMGDGMKKMEQAKGKDFDLMFVDMMTPHHEGAVFMSREALQKAEHPELKTLAQTIIREQEKEIKQMAEWKTNWKK